MNLKRMQVSDIPKKKKKKYWYDFRLLTIKRWFVNGKEDACVY